jgi:hypothetical protein
MSVLERVGYALRALYDGPPPSRDWADFPAFIPDENPLSTVQGAADRRGAALRMMDPDCYGFLLISVHREAVGVRANVEIRERLHPSGVPALAETLERVTEELEGLK